MPAFNYFNPFVENLCEGLFDFSSDTLKIALTNTAPADTQSVFDTVTNHPPPTEAHGYTSGGYSVTVDSHAQAAGVFTLAVTTDITVSASGGQIGPFRYAVLYDDTSATKPLIGFWDYGSSVTLEDGDSITLDITDSLFTLSIV